MMKIELTTLTIRVLAILAALIPLSQGDQCLSNDEFENFFLSEGEVIGDLPRDGSCCMKDICGLPCPTAVPAPTSGFGIAVAVSIAFSFVVGLLTYFVVKGETVNFFVAGRSLPLWIVVMTLGAQSVDSNALLGNVDYAYKFSFWDGACLPVGLGLSLILNGIFLARHINNDQVLTLPDIYAKRYGPLVEILVSLATITSFLFLLAGNFVGMSNIISYVWGIDNEAAVWITAFIVWAYTVSGGAFSVAYTDVAQFGLIWIGCLACALYLIKNEDNPAPPPSIGFLGYVYPDSFGDGGTCDMYEGVKCTVDTSLCCYNADKWCPSESDCFTDNGAYPFGDKRVYSDQMTNPSALTPFPNAILWDWCTIFILGVGNLGALDFQARCMSSKNARVATLGCLIAGCMTFLVGIPFSYLGAITRVHYGPDSAHAEFIPDTCSTILGLPTCAAWVPDDLAFIKFLTHQAPAFLGGFCLIGIVAASMSTADGAIFAMGTVSSHNLLRQLDSFYPGLVTTKNLLLVTRLTSIPFTVISACVAAYNKSTSSNTGYLLIVAFDVVLATVVVPLFGCFYAKKPSPRAAFLAILCGALTRIILEVTLPKDGYLLFPFDAPEFYDYGSAASTAFPGFFDVNATDIWEPEVEKCVQRQFEDYTGIDSVSAFFVSLIVFLTVQFLERNGAVLFTLPGMVPYEKESVEHIAKAEKDCGVDEDFEPEKEIVEVEPEKPEQDSRA